MNQQVVVNTQQSPPVAEVAQQTFTEAFQSAAAAFLQGVKALKASGLTVETAAENVKAAQDNLATMQGVSEDLSVSIEGQKAVAMSSRDELVAVLQSWVPS